MTSQYPQGPYPQQPGYPGQWGPPPAPRGPRTGLIIGVILGVLVLVGGGITAVVLTSNQGHTTAASTTSSTTSTVPISPLTTTPSSSYSSSSTFATSNNQQNSVPQVGQCFGPNSQNRAIVVPCGSATSSRLIVKIVNSLNECPTGYRAFGAQAPFYCTTGNLKVGDCLDAKAEWKTPCTGTGFKVLLIVPGPHQTGACHPQGSTLNPTEWTYNGVEPPEVACLGPQ